MKKTLLSMLLAASCFGVANAQLMVDEKGHIGLNIETNDTIKSNIGINTLGNEIIAVAMTQDATVHPIGLKIYRNGNYPVTGTMLKSLSAGGDIQAKQHNIGVFGRAWSNTMKTEGRAFGVMGVGGGATSGWNFGVCGMLTGTNYGAGVYGSASWDNGCSVPGLYAGYFNGIVGITEELEVPEITADAITAEVITTPSDYRLKENVKSVDSGTLSGIMNMNVVEYNYIETAEEIVSYDLSDTATVSTASMVRSREISPAPVQKHYGFIAQELQEIYPDLVVEDEEGFLGINYLEIIPLLVRSIQELKAEVNTLRGDDAPIYKAQTRTTDVTDIDAVVTALYQNTPNPFTESTVIRCDIAEDVVKANLYIYNMNGEQIAEFSVTERGETSVTIDGGSLNAGMYLYALITDGQVIDTKRMILTK